MIQKNGEYSRKELRFYDWEKVCSLETYEIWHKKEKTLIAKKITEHILKIVCIK